MPGFRADPYSCLGVFFSPLAAGHRRLPSQRKLFGEGLSKLVEYRPVREFLEFACNSGKRFPCHRDHAARETRTGSPDKQSRSSGGHFPSSLTRQEPEGLPSFPASVIWRFHFPGLSHAANLMGGGDLALKTHSPEMSHSLIAILMGIRLHSTLSTYQHEPHDPHT